MRMSLTNKIFVSLLTLLLIVYNSQQELFTAIVDLERLLETEKSIANLLDEYIQRETDRLSRLRLFRDHYERIHTIASRDTQGYLANPVNAFLLVKRLTTDWKMVENLVSITPAEIGRATIANLTKSIDFVNSFPSGEDLSGAADALLRLQDTYKLDTATIARGQIPINYSHSRDASSSFISNELELSAGDCFELGRHSYTIGDHYHTVLWMSEALDRAMLEQAKTADEAEILEYLAFSVFKQGDVAKALELTDRLLKLNPTHERAIGNKEYYENYLKSQSTSKKGDDDGDDIPQDKFVKVAPTEMTERQSYESLCRGEERLSPKVQASLKCYHLNTSHAPYLRLMRIKVEEAFKKPYIVMYHEIMSDEEIKVIKKLSSPHLKRATVQNSQTGALETAHYRISKSAWLKTEDHPVIKNVNRRIGLITNLNLESAEELQVVNYGIGGHYDAHYDFARKEETNAFKNLGTGNRIATWLNYMSDVEAGGATVFTELKVTIWPRKRSAAFWWNLHRSGDGDMLTRHAACPVLVGSKWVSNKWFHERGQEFTRPCGLKVTD